MSDRLLLSRGADICNLEPHVGILYKMCKESTPDTATINVFNGFKLSDLHGVENIFHIHIYIYELLNDPDNTLSCHLICRYVCKYRDTLNLNLFKRIFHL